MLTGTNQQIVTAYETLDMSAADISQEFDMEELSVKACLMQFSDKYRQATKKMVNNDFNDDELVEANQAIIATMRNTEDEHLRLRAARYIRDDKKGRLDILNGIGKMNVNIVMFNERLLQARQAKEKSKQLNEVSPTPPAPINEQSAGETIDIESELVEH